MRRQVRMIVLTQRVNNGFVVFEYVRRSTRTIVSLSGWLCSPINVVLEICCSVKILWRIQCFTKWIGIQSHPDNETIVLVLLLTYSETTKPLFHLVTHLIPIIFPLLPRRSRFLHALSKHNHTKLSSQLCLYFPRLLIMSVCPRIKWGLEGLVEAKKLQKDCEANCVSSSPVSLFSLLGLFYEFKIKTQ